jgi:hypothetical protein
MHLPLGERRVVLPVIRLALAVVLAHGTAAAQSAPQVKSCEGGLCCEVWGVDLRDKAGKVWGLIEGASPDEVRKKLTKAQAFDKSYCRFFGHASPCSKHEHDDPGPLRCTSEVRADTDESSLCLGETQRRLDALDKKLADQTGRFKRSHQTLTTLRAVTGRIAPADPLGAPLSTLASYGASFNDAAGRAQRIRQAVQTECFKATLDGIDRHVDSNPSPPRAIDVGDAPLYWLDNKPTTESPLLWLYATGENGSAMARLYGLKWAGGGYGGTIEQAAKSRKALVDLAELEKIVEALDVPDLALASVALKRRGTARSKSRSGTGRLLLAGHGELSGDKVLEGGALSLAFVVPGKDGLQLGSVTSELKTGARGAETLVITGTAGGDREVIEIELEADRDGDGFADSIDDCPDQHGAIRGCADGDGDGIADRQDRCPQQWGSQALGGCPDSDGDTVADADDRCPQQRGDPAWSGCERPSSPPMPNCGPDPRNNGVANNNDRNDPHLLRWKLCYAVYFRERALWVLPTGRFQGASATCLQHYIAAMTTAIGLYQSGRRDDGDTYAVARGAWGCAADVHLDDTGGIKVY